MSFRKEGFWTKVDEHYYVLESAITNENALTTAFSAEQQDGLWDLEDGSWWFQYRASVIVSAMDRFFDKNQLTLDVGGGNGYTTACAMKAGYEMGLIEPSVEACQNAIKREIPNVNCGVASDESIVDYSINQVLLLDVLEHIEDDEGFLELLGQKIVRGGIC